jgi:hypothetical protein
MLFHKQADFFINVQRRCFLSYFLVLRFGTAGKKLMIFSHAPEPANPYTKGLLSNELGRHLLGHA